MRHISIQSQRICVSGHPSLPRVSRHIYGTPGTTETIVNCCRRASFVREAAAAAVEEIAVGVNETPVDGFDLPPSVTSDEFSLYVAVDADVQTAAEVTDEELCAGQQAAADVDTDGR